VLGVLLLAGTGCRGAQVQQVNVMAIAGVSRGLDEDASESGALHPSAWEAILFHPALPYAFGGHGGHRPGPGYLDARAVAPALNRVLAGSVNAVLVGGGTMVEIQVSRRTGLVTATWHAGSPNWAFGTQAVLFDLSRVAGAFDPSAPLETAAVVRHMTVRLEEP